MAAPSIPDAEVAEIFRQALRSEISVTVVGGQSWDEAFCGDVEFRFGDWRVIFFNDCGELDYTDRAIAPEGRESDCEEWSEAAKAARGVFWHCPLDLLNSEEYAALERLVKGAPIADQA